MSCYCTKQKARLGLLSYTLPKLYITLNKQQTNIKYTVIINDSRIQTY